jgi:hypothetical protein
MDVSGNDPTPPPEDFIMFEDDDNDEMDELEVVEIDFDHPPAEIVYEKNPPHARGPGRA